MRKFLAVLVGIVFMQQIAFSQTGIIRGKVIDEKTGETMIGANIIVIDSDPLIGTITDFDGNFTLLNVPAGTCNLQFSMISFETKVVESVEVKEDDVTILDIALGQATLDIAEVTVKAAAVKNTETALLTIQRKSATVVDGISAQQIKKLGDGNAAEALKRVTGVSVEGGKYVYVRGLSDRYMVVTLNGAQMPGLDPNKNTVQMDLFPSNLIENMVVHKTYSPEYPSFTGGHVDIITKDFPERFTLNVSAGLGYNPQANLNSDFLYYEGSSTDWLGFDDGKRDIPDYAKSFYVNGLFTGEGRRDSINTLSKSFNKQYSPVRKTSFLNQSYKVSIGNQINFLKKPLGLIASFSYKNKYNYYESGEANNYDAESISLMKPTETNAETYGEQEVIWSGLLSGTYKLNNNNKIGITYIRNQNGSSGARYRDGYQNYDSKYVQKRNLEYLQRSMSTFQIKGKHVFESLNNGYVDWQSSYTLSKLKEPDNRDFLNYYQLDTTVAPPDTTKYDLFTNRDPRRRYRDMSETGWDSKIDFTIPINVFNNKSKIKFGASYLYKYRNSDESQYTLSSIVDPEIYDGIPEHYVADSNFISEESPWYLLYYNSSDYSDKVTSYRAEDITKGAYVMLDLKITDELRVTTGIRHEINEAFVERKVETPKNDDSDISLADYGKSSTHDFMPSINLTYSIKESMNIRFAASKTVTRPAFRERAPYDYYDFDLGATVSGNPELKNSYVDNLDLRWEYFFGRGEMVSVSGFYKKIRKPIERFRVNKTVSRMEYRNGNDGTIYGIEFELRKKLHFIEPLKNFQIGTNVTLIKSEAKVYEARYNEAIKIVPNFSEYRPMYGQSPYIINGYISYANSELGLSSNLALNVNGPKIVVIEKFHTPNVYEMPEPKLNFNISKSLAKNWKISFSAENLLDAEKINKYWNSDFENTYEFDDDFNYRTHKKGRTFSVSISYSIN